MKEAIAVFGSTGSIGVSTLDVIKRNQSRYRAAALSANNSVEALYHQCLEYKPDVATMVDAEASTELSRRLAKSNSETEVLHGPEALNQIASRSDIPVVMAAIVGFAGLASTVTAAKNGKRILLANKESMVVAGDLLTQAALQGGASIVPVDSEHNAIFQCLPESCQRIPGSGKQDFITSLVLTASGGPFRQYSKEQLKDVSVEQALDHPNWSMGPKITIDSATLMNKGLEVIEASYLFGIDESLIEVVVHPESVIHSMVRYTDGSVLAQMGQADMRTPIAQSLAWPDRIEAGVDPLDFMQLGVPHFEAPDPDRFPCLNLARVALRRGKGATGVLNATNEVAVQQFLDGRITFGDIPRLNTAVLQQYQCPAPETVEDLYRLDQSVREFALDYVERTLSVPVSS